LLRSVLLSFACILALGAPYDAAAQTEPIGGPTLGFARDEAGAVIWPVIGVPGAAALAGRLPLEAEVRGVIISPLQDYAVGLRTDDSSVVVIPLKGGSTGFKSIPGVFARPDLIAISPKGTAVAFYNSENRIIQVVGRLTDAPEVVGAFDISSTMGRVSGVSLSDDGALALVNLINGDAGSTELWVVNASSVLLAASQTSVVPAFVPNRHDAVIADDSAQAVFLVTDVDQTAIRIPVLSAGDGLSAFSNVAVSGEGRSVVIADSTSGTVAIVDTATFRPTIISCQCRLTGLYRMKQDSMFRLTDASSSEPVTVLDISSGEPRTFIIPLQPVEASQ